MPYKILQSQWDYNIEKQVNEHLNDGYELAGGLHMRSRGAEVQFLQAVYKKENIVTLPPDNIPLVVDAPIPPKPTFEYYKNKLATKAQLQEMNKLANIIGSLATTVEYGTNIKMYWTGWKTIVIAPNGDSKEID